MERTGHSHIGRIKKDDLNPTEKLMDLMKIENFQKLLGIIEKSKFAAEAINENFIPFSKSTINTALIFSIFSG